MTAKGFDRDNAFFLGAIEGDHLRFRVLSRTGAVVDTGTILAPLVPPPAPEPPEQPDPDPPVPLPDSPAPPCVPADVRGDAPATRVVGCFPP
jgi:hypothetical protein